jgi:hypothetical protein
MRYELIGLCGTVFILIAFLFNSEKEIRIFDMIGSVLFVIYGALIGAYSNVVLNGALIIVHIIKLQKMRMKG